MSLFDTVLEVSMPEDALAPSACDVYRKIGEELDRLGVESTVAVNSSAVRFSFTIEADDEDEARDKGLMALLTATLYIAGTSVAKKGPTFDANRQN